MNIDAFIKRCNFSEDDINDATDGECMCFALALHRILNSRKILNRLVAATNSDDVCNWSHVFIQSSGYYFDIRGKVSGNLVHKEFNTDIIRNTSENELRVDIARFIKLKQHPFYNMERDRITSKWHRRLMKKL